MPSYSPLSGERKGQDTIKATSKTKSNIPLDGGVWRIQEVTNLQGEGSGDTLFDRAKGRFSSSAVQMKTNGVVVVEIGGTKLRVDFFQSEEIRITTTDTLSELSNRK
jgi:hypothetical protein